MVIGHWIALRYVIARHIMSLVRRLIEELSIICGDVA